MKGRHYVGWLERVLILANQALVVAMMAAMVALVFANVVARYAFGQSMIWAEEISQYLMVWIAYLGAGLALREGRHVAVELVQAALPGRLRTAVRWTVALCVLLFFIALAVLGFQFAVFARDLESPMLQIPLAIPYLAVAFGAALFAIHLLLFLRAYAYGRFDEPAVLDPLVHEPVLHVPVVQGAAGREV